MYIDTINVGNGRNSYTVEVQGEPYQVLVGMTNLQGVLNYINTSCNTTGLKATRRSKNTWQLKNPATGYQYIIKKVN